MGKGCGLLKIRYEGGANAIVSIDIDYEGVSGATFALMVTTSGTAVKIR